MVLTVNSQKSMLSRLLLLCILPFILLKEGFPWLTLQVAPLGFSEDGVTLPNKKSHISDKEHIILFAYSKKFTKENTLPCYKKYHSKWQFSITKCQNKPTSMKKSSSHQDHTPCRFCQKHIVVIFFV